MLVLAILTALVLLVTTILVVFRALDYVHQHPEILRADVPVTYQRCQITLFEVIDRYKQIEAQFTLRSIVTWRSPSSRFYRVSSGGVEEQRETGSTYRLDWEDIGGVGIRMQPGFKVVDHNRDGWADSQYTMGYSFNLLIVPISGSTMDIYIPTDGHPDAVNFVAFTIAFANHMKRRINVFGFDKPPAPYHQKIPKI
jgi:hypothetical protein